VVIPRTMSRVLRRAAFRALAGVVTLAMSAAGLAAVAGPAAAADTATINGATTFQAITGFGASEAFGQADAIMNAPAAAQQQALNLLFSPTSGAGLTILRNEISADPGITIEPAAPASPAAAPAYSPLGTDQGQEWLAQTIKADYGVTNVFADAWSAPGFMKASNSPLNGGTLCGAPGAATCASGDWRQAYANYLVQYAKDYAADGVPLTYLGPMNEPSFTPSGYDGMTLTPAQAANLIDVLGPALKASGLPTQVECCTAIGWDSAQQYAAAIEADPTALSYTPLFTSHGYSAPPNSPLAGWTRPVWQTEWSTFETWDPAWDDNTDASGLTWAQNIYTGLTAANLNAFLYWWGSSPASVSNDNGNLIQINGSTVVTSARLWAFANYSRFIRPGAVRIAATSSNSADELTAFKNADGSVAIVALNTAQTADPVTFALSGTGTANGATVTPYLTNASSDTAAQPTIPVSGGAFTATIPARSLVTYDITAGSTGAGNVVTVTNPGNQAGATGTAASVPIHASDSAAGQTLSYSAAGLPAGLSINSSTGLISGTPTAGGTSTVTVTVRDATGASGSTTFTWAVAAPAGACAVSYSTQSQWAGGFVASVTISNPGTSPINGWTLGFTFPGDQKITNSWNGVAAQSAKSVSITSENYNSAIAAGASTSIGFQGTWTTSDAVPTAFTVNGTACST
jgi:O-glycosyl hydrolase